MINSILIQGSKETTWHDFEITQEGMDITLLPGSYWRGGTELAIIEAPTSITIDTPTEEAQLEIWLNGSGETVAFEILLSGDPLSELAQQPIDRIAWLTVPAGVTTLDDVEVNIIKITE